LREYSFVPGFLERCVMVRSVCNQFILQLRLFKRLYNYLKGTL
jgi:hypothetical protein